MTYGVSNHFQCAKCESQKLTFWHSDGGCDSCGYGSYIEVECLNCGIKEKIE